MRSSQHSHNSTDNENAIILRVSYDSQLIILVEVIITRSVRLETTHLKPFSAMSLAQAQHSVETLSDHLAQEADEFERLWLDYSGECG